MQRPPAGLNCQRIGLCHTLQNATQKRKWPLITVGAHRDLPFSPQNTVAEVPTEGALQPGTLWGPARFSRSLPSISSETTHVFGVFCCTYSICLETFLGGGGGRYASSEKGKSVRACQDFPLATPCASQTALPASPPACGLLHCVRALCRPSGVDAVETICALLCQSFHFSQKLPKALSDQNRPSISVRGRAAGLLRDGCVPRDRADRRRAVGAVR